MKLLLFIGISISLSSACHAFTSALDTFTEGAFILTEDGTWTDQSPISEPIISIDTRRVSGSGLGDWSCTLTEGAGFLEYNALEITPAGRPFAISISYASSSGGFNLLGYDSFLLDFGELSGSGMLEISLTSSDEDSVVSVPLTSSGLVEYSFDKMAASSLVDVARLSIQITPDTSPFSFQLNEVAIVPEPNAMLLAFMGILGVLKRRRT